MSAPPPPHDWDARSYSETAKGVEALGSELLGRLTLRGDETVLDAGCGPGTVTRELVALLPRGRVVAVDASPAMVAAARAALGETADVRQADLTSLDLGELTVDAVFSSATFHWIADHAKLFENLRRVMCDGGQLVAQCGGEGNIAPFRETIAAVGATAPFDEHLAGFDPWNFAGPESTEALLQRCGFAHARCWLEPRPVPVGNARDFMSTVIAGAHLERLPEPLRGEFVDRVLASTGDFDASPHVRLNIEAVA